MKLSLNITKKSFAYNFSLYFQLHPHLTLFIWVWINMKVSMAMRIKHVENYLGSAPGAITYKRDRLMSKVYLYITILYQFLLLYIDIM